MAACESVPGLAYVSPPGADTVLIGKYMMPVPPGMKAEAPEIPWPRRPRSGERPRNTIVAPVPLRPHRAYANDPYQAPPPVRGIEHVRLRLGFLDKARFPPGVPVVEPARYGPPGAFLCDYGFGLQVQELTEVTLTVPAPGVPSGF